MALSKWTIANTEMYTHQNTTHSKAVQSSSYHVRTETTQRVRAAVGVVLGGVLLVSCNLFSGTGTIGKKTNKLLACKPFSEGFGLKIQNT